MSRALELEAPAKLNLGLEVLGRRDDGFHDLATVFQEIDLADRLTVEADDDLHFEVRGLPAPAGEENLVVRAARLLAAEAGCRPRARVRLEKRIPAGAGLGGGSSDAAAALLALNRLWTAGLDYEGLSSLAARLGSDVPFFLLGGTALGLGRGEVLCPLPDLPALAVVLVCPRVGLSTAEVFRRAGFPLTGGRKYNIMRRFAQYVVSGKGLGPLLQNDLQTAATGMLPEIAEWCGALRRQGALAAALTGSGSAVYGLFPDVGSAERARTELGVGERTFLCRFRPRSANRLGE